MSAHQLNSKNKSTVSLFKTIFSTRWNSFLSSVVTYGDDGRGLKTEKNWANFSVNFVPEKIAKNVVRTPYLKGLCHGSLVHFV